MPDGEEGLGKWFKKYGFSPLALYSGEEIVCFETAKDLYNWLRQTGVLAGVSEIFDDFESVESSIINEIEESSEQKSKFSSNHKFVSGVFTKNK